MALFQSLPGFREFPPEVFARRNHLFRVWRRTASAFGFSEYDAPVLESLELYKAKSGDEIEQQLFSFVDKGGREVALRPEMTPTVCRMVGAQAGSLKRPIKWFSIAEFYRYERAQKGRERAFFQLNADIFGEEGVAAEIELISLLVQCLAGFGLTEIQSQAILDMRLARLAALERKKIETEYKEVNALIKDLTDLLKSAKRMRGVVTVSGTASDDTRVAAVCYQINGTGWAQAAGSNKWTATPHCLHWSRPRGFAGDRSRSTSSRPFCPL